MGAQSLQLVGLEKVYDPGAHCAFTDITHWRGRVWLTFREALNHSIHPSSQIVVMASTDLGHSFQVMARIAQRGLDVRDPHFYILDDRLHLTIPCWRNPPVNAKTHAAQRVNILARSDDGINWEVHRELAPLDGRTLWRPRLHPTDGCAYAAAYDRDYDRGIGKVTLMRARDGLNWEDVSVIEDNLFPNETEVCFLPDGTLLALVRRELGDGSPVLAKQAAPYTGTWTKTTCDRWFKGPLLERLADGTLLGIGRVRLDESNPKSACVTRVHRIDIETGALHPAHTLESGGDTSYAGLVRLPEVEGMAYNALLSYYSGHAYPNGAYRDGDNPQRCAIYVARLRLPTK